jgi:hypothetical protein
MRATGWCRAVATPLFHHHHHNQSNKWLSKMHKGKVVTLSTSQDAPSYIWAHTKHTHEAGTTVTVPVKLPKTLNVDGFPVDYVAIVTPSQPCATSVTNQTRYGFTVTLTSLDAQPLAAGTFGVVCIG